jgi:hypothetical protein
MKAHDATNHVFMHVASYDKGLQDGDHFFKIFFSKRFVQKLWTQEELKKDVAITLVLLQ